MICGRGHFRTRIIAPRQLQLDELNGGCSRKTHKKKMKSYSEEKIKILKSLKTKNHFCKKKYQAHHNVKTFPVIFDRS